MNKWFWHLKIERELRKICWNIGRSEGKLKDLIKCMEETKELKHKSDYNSKKQGASAIEPYVYSTNEWLVFERLNLLYIFMRRTSERFPFKLSKFVEFVVTSTQRTKKLYFYLRYSTNTSWFRVFGLQYKTFVEKDGYCNWHWSYMARSEYTFPGVIEQWAPSARTSHIHIATSFWINNAGRGKALPHPDI